MEIQFGTCQYIRWYWSHKTNATTSAHPRPCYSRCAPVPAAPALPESLSEMQNLQSRPTLIRIWLLTKSPGDKKAHYSLRNTNLDSEDRKEVQVLSPRTFLCLKTTPRRRNQQERTITTDQWGKTTTENTEPGGLGDKFNFQLISLPSKSSCWGNGRRYYWLRSNSHFFHT